ncbi:trypsin-like peptidase domain-containing protein [Streptosporangium sp. NPDC051022]|uniref:S1C family serine protease n=1 Tax=Streptosporangium sp. NPDC051022 TaxID=3155752 RepID=UPI00342F7FDA
MAILFVGGLLGGGPQSPGEKTPDPAPGSAVPARRSAVTLETDYRRDIARVLPSIVQIVSQQGAKTVVEGSGIVYDGAGHIVTNAHVVGDATEFEVMLATGGAVRTARLVGAYRPQDVAVIKMDDPAGLVPAAFGDSDQLSIGQIVLAMGNPLGLSGSVTDGIVSGLNRTISFLPEKGQTSGHAATGLIQTSAAINPGNSGGALVDLDGEVVGVLVADVVDVRTGSALPGIGFAIPSNTATAVARRLIEHGEVTDTGRATLGVTARTVVDRRGAPAGVGVVRAAEGDEPARAAIEPGSVIVSVDDTPTLTAQDLNRVLATCRPGDQAKVELLHPDGSTTTTTVTLGRSSGD